MVFHITNKDHAPALITIGVHDFLYFISRPISSCCYNTTTRGGSLFSKVKLKTVLQVLL